MGTKADIFGAALLDFINDEYTEDIVVHSSIAEDDVIPVPYLFRDFKEMPLLEQKALSLSKGKTLDIGSGAGSHSLWLQEQGIDVTGIDISEGAVTLSRKRGLKNSIHEAILDHKGTYDTLLLLMNGTGIFEKVQKIDSYLKHLKSLLSPEGQILIDGSDIAYMFEDEDGGFWVDTHRDYYGEVTYSMSYKGVQGDTFDWLYLDYAKLEWYAKKNELKCELIFEGDHYDYLARLSLT
ncbi:class I SAM-dependent methyltransferase [Dokdonia donghaensis]|uniref:Methyltransferase n=1 Tax=Dokdonia donghaensis DSW-1 TaxID=1300343 RepID=A0A0A2GT73_9FLAO|nr:methyltransferase domain-containing protein [Dokdonia donghaensis]ANH61297.1 bifunctional 3-demethylubiquinone-9 3-methyltransferase/ 2-octaprenyl-6-hydroxy phenol methylase [Dokdonia donghaensis DSW-1]KGO05506.1 methyltransferase [Dokdonia donghaensis DSW-1]